MRGAIQRTICRAGLPLMLLVVGAASALAASEGGSLATAEFPDVVKFDFEKVKAQYDKASENVGKVTPLLDGLLEKGQAAVGAGREAVQAPTDENKRRFVAAVLGFVQGAGQGKAKIAGLSEEVRTVRSQTGILYTQATTQTKARVEELGKEFQREELKYKDLVAQNRLKRQDKSLTDWQLRKLFDEEKRQALVLSRLADRVSFQEDFLKALQTATGRSDGDFVLYEQFFAEAGDVLGDIGDLASNLPMLVERLQIASAMSENILSRRAAVAGFAKIEQARSITKELADQLMKVCAGELEAGDDGEVETIIMQHTETYSRWLDGESVDYRRPGKTSD